MNSPIIPDGNPFDGAVLPTEDAALDAPPAAPEPSPPPPPPPPPPRAVRFPVTWLLEHAGPAIRYRAVKDVVQPETLPAGFENVPLANPDAIALAVSQDPDGVWHDRMLTPPREGGKHFAGVGTIPATRRLLEYGWDVTTPPVHRSRRLLFRLLAEDQSPEFLYELASQGELSDDLVRRGRGILREAAAATLAQAGFEADPRLRGAARRILDRIGAWLRSPAAAKMFVRVGNVHTLPPEAAPPSIYSLTMLAYMPLFRHEHYDTVERIYEAITQPQPRSDSVQQVGSEIVPQPHLVLGDPLPTRNAADADVPGAMHWLELMARNGYLKRNENWTKIYDRYLDCCDAGGVFKPSKGMSFEPKSPDVWHAYPLDTDPVVETTFRLGVIGRYAGRPIEPV